jgi:hypothetical protein
MEKEFLFAQEITRILKKNRVFDEQKARDCINLFKERSKGRFEYFLLDEGLVEKEDYLQALSEFFTIPAFDCSGFFFETHLLHLFPKDIMLRNAFIPVQVDQSIMLIVANNPTNELRNLINIYVVHAIEFNVGIERDITDAISEYYDESVTEEDELDEW